MKKPLKKITWILLLPTYLGLLWLVLSIFFAALSFHIYSRLSIEKPIAQIRFEKQQDRVFKAYLKVPEQTVMEYKILGDQWRMDAQFIKLKPWANVLGLDAFYQLERFEGRYKKIREQNRLPKLAYDLGESKSLQLPRFLIEYNFLVDAEYGSSTYLSIDESLIYTVYKTQSGIIVRHEVNPDYQYNHFEILKKIIPF